MAARRIKTPAQRRVADLKKRARKSVKVAKKKAKRTRKAVAKRGRKIVRGLKRNRKRVVKAARKRLRSYKRSRVAAERRRFTRRRITTSDDGDVVEFTTDRTRTNNDTAYLPDYGNAFGASQPGEPPKMRTGRGRDAIQAELITRKRRKTDVASRVFVNKRKAAYMALWEYRPDDEQRPFLKPSLSDNRAMLGNIIGQSLRQQLRGVTRRRK